MADRICINGHDPATCCDLDIRDRLGGHGKGKYKWHCPAHDDTRPSLSINPGTQGMRIVWHCKAGCSAEAVRAALLKLGIDESCLGTYGSSRGMREPSRGSHQTARDLDARRWHAVAKLDRGLNGSLLVMCIQAIAESDGDVSGDAAQLLPVGNRDDFIALAVRSGIDRKYCYRLYRKWLAWLDDQAA